MTPRRTTRLKALFQRPELVVLPGGADPIAARMAERAGFECFYLSGGLTSAYLLGKPDSSASQRDMIDAARRICLSIDIPVLADMDTGYGDAISVYNTVREYIHAGVAGAHLEDRGFPPRPGRWATFVSPDEMAQKLKAATAAKMEFDPDFVLIARTDWMIHPGATIEQAIERATIYKNATDIDVSAIYINTSWNDAKQAIQEIPGPVLPLFRATVDVHPTLDEQQEAGAAGAWYPSLTERAGIQANWEFLHQFLEKGSTALDDLYARAKSSKYGVMNHFALTGEHGGPMEKLYEQYLYPSA